MLNHMCEPTVIDTAQQIEILWLSSFDFQHNPVHICSEVNPFVFTGAYTEENVHRIAAKGVCPHPQAMDESYLHVYF